MTDDDLITFAIDCINENAVSVYADDQVQVSVRERRHWWSLRKSWREVAVLASDDPRFAA